MPREAKTDAIIEFVVHGMSIDGLQNCVRDYLRQFYESKDSDEFNEIYNQFSEYLSKNEGRLKENA